MLESARKRLKGANAECAKSAPCHPAVGDYVLADLNRVDAAMIRRVPPRTGVFLRKAAGVAVSEQIVAANEERLKTNGLRSDGGATYPTRRER